MGMDSKEAFVHDLFSTISGRYDLLNTLLSTGLDQQWRRSVMTLGEISPHWRVLDCCTGTGKLAMELGRHGCQVTGIDFCTGMIERARRAAERSSFSQHLSFVPGNVLSLPFGEESFDAVTTAFSLRNLPRLRDAFLEMKRVVRPGGRVIFLELTRPRNPVLKILHTLYLSTVVPLLGWVLAGSFHSYSYLSSSILAFHEPDQILALMEEVGFSPVRGFALSAGIATIGVGERP